MPSSTENIKFKHILLVSLIKGCVCYIFASLFLSLKDKNSIRSWENQSLEF